MSPTSDRPNRPADGTRAIPGYYLTRRATMWEDALRRPRPQPSPPRPT